MARGKPVEIGSWHFPTQDAATKHFREMLSKYLPGDRVSDDDSIQLDQLIKRHPDYKQKIGEGEHHFEVMRNIEKWGTKCFCVIQSDGTRADFSFATCVTGRI